MAGRLYTRSHEWLAVEGKTRVGDLDDEGEPRRFGLSPITCAPSCHGHVGLGFRFFVQGNGELDADAPLRPEGGHERLIHELDGQRVRITMRLADDELTTEQFETLVGTEDVFLDQPPVLEPGPAADLRGGIAHAPRLVLASRVVNVREEIQESARRDGGASEGIRAVI